jgi:hypothetical protein
MAAYPFGDLEGSEVPNCRRVGNLGWSKLAPGQRFGSLNRIYPQLEQLVTSKTDENASEHLRQIVLDQDNT